MGTRGALGFRYGDTDKVAYNHFDSYPSGLGIEVVKTIRKWNDEQLAGAAARIEMFDPEVPPTAAQKERYADMADLAVSNRSLDDWYCLLRHAQGDLDTYIDGTVDHMSIGGPQFLFDSLFCEWAYIINMDTRNLEIYHGFNKSPDGKGRYAATLEDPPVDYQGNVYRKSEYYGVSLITEIPLSEIRSWDEDTAYMAALEEIVYAEDELTTEA